MSRILVSNHQISFKDKNPRNFPCPWKVRLRRWSSSRKCYWEEWRIRGLLFGLLVWERIVHINILMEFSEIIKKHMWTELEGVFSLCVFMHVFVCLEHTAWLSESMSRTICHHCILSVICCCSEVRSNLFALLPSKLIFYHHEPPVSLIDYFFPYHPLSYIDQERESEH